jgi:hypothetical protein
MEIDPHECCTRCHLCGSLCKKYATTSARQILLCFMGYFMVLSFAFYVLNVIWIGQEIWQFFNCFYSTFYGLGDIIFLGIEF